MNFNVIFLGTNIPSISIISSEAPSNLHSPGTSFPSIPHNLTFKGICQSSIQFTNAII